MIIAFIFGLVIIFNILFLYCLLQMVKKGNEMEEKYERKNKKNK